MEKVISDSSQFMLNKSRKTNQSTASGLKAWHRFAVYFLGYQQETSIPPWYGHHVIKFCYLFNNKGTASNYVGHIKWACNNKGLSVEWYDGQLRQFLQGVENVHDYYFMGVNGANFLMTQHLVNLVVTFCREKQWWQTTMANLISWEFLLRVQSEGLQLWIGKESDKECLPPGRNSGLWIDGDNNLCLRLRTRRNRKYGMTMRRACSCANGEVPQRTCAVHVFKKYKKKLRCGGPHLRHDPA